MRKLIIILLFTPFLMMGQIFKSPNQQFVEQAIKDGIFIIKQTYQLEDTTTQQRFGRYGNEEFGSFSSLAIRTKDGYIVDSRLLSPWDSDNNYSRYRASHKPVIARSFSKELEDSIMSPIKFSTDSLNGNQSRLAKLCPQDSLFTGFNDKRYNQTTEGWVVWLSNDSTLNDYNGSKNPELTIFKRTIDFQQDSVSYKIDTPNTSKQIWGGIFVVPEQTEIGQITFYLGGVIVKDVVTNEWIIVTPTQSATVILSRPEDELTPLNQQPVDNKKKKRK